MMPAKCKTFAIMSDMDSRGFLYYLMLCFQYEHRTCIVSSNPYYRRLVNQDLTAQYGNCTVCFVSEDTVNVEQGMKDNGLDPLEFDTVFSDNVYCDNPTMNIILFNEDCGENELYNLEIMLDNDNILVAVPGNGTFRNIESLNKLQKEQTKVATKEDYVPEQKWNGGKTQQEIIYSKLMTKDRFNFDPMPTLDINRIEGNGTHSGIPRKTAEMYFKVFEKYINMQKTTFLREVTKARNENWISSN